MRLGQPSTPLQCRALGDSGLVLRRDRSSLSIFSAAELATRRSLHKIVPLNTRRPRYPVIKNSLRKTLDAQRLANRERLIRKVYNEPDGLNAPPVTTIELPVESEGSAEVELPKPRRSRRPLTKEPKHERSLDSAVRAPWVGKGDGATIPPWLDKIHETPSRNPSSALSSEITALARFLQPSSAERLVVNDILDGISRKLHGIVPHPPQLVGSRALNIASSTSAIDFLIPLTSTKDTSRRSSHRPTPMNPRATKTFTEIINKAESEMNNSGLFDECHAIYGKSPALIMSHKASGLSIRIFCGSSLPKSLGFMQDSLTQYPSLQPLYMALRVLLESKSMFGWDAASVDSYGLFLLITSFLKQQTNKNHQTNIGEQLLELLNTFGSGIDLTTTGISVNPALFFDVASIRSYEAYCEHQHKSNAISNSINASQKIYPPWLVGQRALMRYKINAGIKGNQPIAKHLCIQDPTNHLNDVGLRCLRTAELQQVLSQLHDELQIALRSWQHGDRGSSYGILSQVLVHTNVDDLLRRRKMLGV